MAAHIASLAKIAHAPISIISAQHIFNNSMARHRSRLFLS